MKRLLFPLLCAVLALSACRHLDTPETVQGVSVHRPYYSIEEEHWVLFELEGKPVELTGDPRRPSLRLSAHPDGAQRVTGSGGVNRLAGTYDIDDRALKFGPLITTKMAGAPEEMELERRFLGVLGRVTTWQRQERVLVLLEGTVPVAKFVVQSGGLAEPRN